MPPQEVLEYGHYLGMLFPEDGRFLWIAEEALGAPLPPDWTMCKDPAGLVYFYQAIPCPLHARYTTVT